MSGRILITGISGLIGTRLHSILEQIGTDISGLDLRGDTRFYGDVCNSDEVNAAMDKCTGIVHLAAVSRVVWGERDPALCRRTNIDGTRTVIQQALSQKEPPWMIFASSREVYGQPSQLPVVEDLPLSPLNIYAESKAAGEQMIMEARQGGLKTAILRLSNVYGNVDDHKDRVVPAFASGAVNGSPLRVEGGGHTFDFTHLDDTVAGVVKLIQLLDTEKTAPPPIHLLTGRPTTLDELAKLAIEVAKSQSTIYQAPSRSYDVAHFWGDPSRAQEILGWKADTTLREGLSRLVSDFQKSKDYIQLENAS